MTRAEKEDQEATQFAMELLMPRDLVWKEYSKKPFDITDDKALKRFADKFQVPAGAMAMRIGQLSFIYCNAAPSP